MMIHYVKNRSCLSNAYGVSEKITNSFLRLRQEFNEKRILFAALSVAGIMGFSNVHVAEKPVGT
ncbi:hypothetical protein ACTWKC_10980 [Bacillus sp. 4A_MP3]